MPFPTMKSGSGTILGLYDLGRYTCMLIQDPESIGPIKYLYMLIVSEHGSKAASVVVTCEHNEMQSELLGMATGLDEAIRKEMIENAPPAYFCYFDKQGGHHTGEPFERVPDAEAFRTKAFAFVSSKLGISDIPVLLNSPPTVLGTRASQGNKYLLLFGVAITIVIGTVMLYVFLQQPKNVNDCILKNMPGATSDRAAQMIRNACQNKFPE